MGKPGSGKSTQAKLLAQQLGLPYIKTGNIYRRLAEENSPLGHKVKATIEKGDLVDDETTFEVVDKYLKTISTGFIIDGFPRTLVQAQREVFPVDKVINIDIPDSEAQNRLLKRAQTENRADDTAEVIEERLKVYHQATEPILNYYQNNAKLSNIDGRGSIEEVQLLIAQSLK